MAGKKGAESVHGVVTDPPYGVVEYQSDQLAKRQAGSGGVWRVPPALDGHVRKPVPRFTTLTPEQLDQLSIFFAELGRNLVRVLVPGAHVFLANAPSRFSTRLHCPLRIGPESVASWYALYPHCGAETGLRTLTTNSQG